MSLERAQARVEFDDTKISPEKIATAVDQLVLHRVLEQRRQHLGDTETNPHDAGQEVCVVEREGGVVVEDAGYVRRDRQRHEQERRDQQQRRISFTQADDMGRISHRKQLLPAPHASIPALEGVPVKGSAGSLQIVAGQQRGLAVQAIGTNLIRRKAALA